METWRQELYINELYHAELYHHGIKGMKWGRRRYQNPDGSLTAEGRRHLGYSSSTTKKYRSEYGANSEKYKKSAELDRKIGKKMLDDHTNNRGHKAVKNLLLGSTGTMTYNMARAAGYSKGRSAVKAILDINVGRAVETGVGNLASTAARGLPGGQLLGGVAGRFAGDVVGSKINKSGKELSLQQRAIRKHYVNGTVPKSGGSSKSSASSSSKSTSSSGTKKKKKDYRHTAGYALATSPLGQAGLKGGQAIQRRKLEKQQAEDEKKKKKKSS